MRFIYLFIVVVVVFPRGDGATVAGPACGSRGVSREARSAAQAASPGPCGVQAAAAAERACHIARILASGADTGDGGGTRAHR